MKIEYTKGILRTFIAYIMIGGNAMKTMKIEKQLLFADNVKQVVKLQVNDGLEYQKESDGIRAMGPLYISGQYVNGEGVMQDFQEMLEMDVLAPNHKLSTERFYLDVFQYQGNAVDGGIGLEIIMNIHGLNDDMAQSVQKKNENEADYVPLHQDVQQPTQVSSIEQIPAPVMVEEECEDEMVSDKAEVIDEMNGSEFEDLFEDAGTTYTSYRMVVARNNDSYASIAQRYEVGEEDLRSANKNKDIMEKTLVILPSVSA